EAPSVCEPRSVCPDESVCPAETRCPDESVCPAETRCPVESACGPTASVCDPPSVCEDSRRVVTLETAPPDEADRNAQRPHAAFDLEELKASLLRQLTSAHH